MVEESLAQQQASPWLLLVPLTALMIALVLIMLALITAAKSPARSTYTGARVANLRMICWLLTIILIALATGLIVEMWRALH